MIPLWHRGGLLTFAFYGFGLPLGATLAPVYPWPARLVGDGMWELLLGLLLGSYGAWRCGAYLNRDEQEDLHRLFGVRMETWGLLGLVPSLLAFGWLAVAGLRHPPPDSGAAPHTAEAAHRPAGAPAAGPGYQVTAVARTGPQVDRWLFEVNDRQGVSHTMRLGERIDEWTLAAYTNGFLVLQEIGGPRRLPLFVPKDR